MESAARLLRIGNGGIADTSSIAEPEAVAATSKARFYPNLEAARGVAALMVACFHAGGTSYLSADGSHTSLLRDPHLPFHWAALPGQILGNGVGAVILFFVLSGFVLALTLERSAESLGQSALGFFGSRIVRIFPAALTTLALFVALHAAFGATLPMSGSFDPLNVMRNALLLKTDINGVTWSLQFELLGAPLIFAAFWLHRRFGVVPLAVIFTTLLGLSFASQWQALFDRPSTFAPLYSFVAGMAAYFYGRGLVDRLQRPGVALAIGLACFAMARIVLGFTSVWSGVAETVSSAAIVALLAFGPFRVMPRFYGRISYSFYLLHALTLPIIWSRPDLLGALVAAGVPRTAIALVLLVGSVAAITPLAWLQYLVVEVGSGRLWHAFERRLRLI
ncbi:MAG TPA: acyltransferase [Rhodopseudomonas sp.]|uniref:acyltransferase family protein n=1 Tax=Rhodopseudomonas sp. TaxID=1078 RepID=UPI002ED7808D